MLFLFFHGALKAFPLPSMTEFRHKLNSLSSSSAKDSGRTNLRRQVDANIAEASEETSTTIRKMAVGGGVEAPVVNFRNSVIPEKQPR